MLEAKKITPEKPELLTLIARVQASLSNSTADSKKLDMKKVEELARCTSTLEFVDKLLKRPIGVHAFDKIISDLSNYLRLGKFEIEKGNLESGAELLRSTSERLDLLFEDFIEHGKTTYENPDDYAQDIERIDIPCSKHLAKVLMLLKNDEEALDHWKFIMRHDRENVEALLNAGKCAFNLQKYGWTWKYLDTAKELDNQNKDMIDMRNKVAEIFALHEEVIKNCKDTINLNKTSFDAYFKMGQSNYTLDRYGRALDNFKKAYKINPRNKELPKLIFKAKNDLKEAQEEFENDIPDDSSESEDENLNDPSGSKPTTSKYKPPPYHYEETKFLAYLLKEKYPKEDWIFLQKRIEKIRKDAPNKNDEEIFYELSERIENYNEAWNKHVEACDQMISQIQNDLPEFCRQEIMHWLHHFKGEEKISAPQQDIIDQIVLQLKEVQKILVPITDDDEMLLKLVKKLSQSQGYSDRNKYPLSMITFEVKRTLNYIRRRHPEYSENGLFFAVDRNVYGNLADNYHLLVKQFCV